MHQNKIIILKIINLKFPASNRNQMHLLINNKINLNNNKIIISKLKYKKNKQKRKK